MNKIFFIPLGLPGLGKSTFAHYLKCQYKTSLKVLNYDDLLLRHQ